MELRIFVFCLATFAIAHFVECSVPHHSLSRRDTADEVFDDESFLNDAANDDDAQNDGNDPEEEEEMVNARIETEPARYNVTVGRKVRLECRVNPSENVVVRWSKNNELYLMGNNRSPLVSSRFSIGPNSNDMLISDVKPSDSGVYKCEVIQDKPLFIEHNLMVLQMPRVISFKATDDGSVTEGSDLLLTCNVSGSPQPQIVWSREVDGANKRLQEQDGEFSLNSVFIKNVNIRHSGKYYCYAFNSVGSNQAELQVTVFGKPHVHIAKPTMNSAIGIEALLECSVHQNGKIRWFKDNVLIHDSDKYQISTEGLVSNLTVIPESDEDFGVFTCEAKNEYGEHSKSIELVQSPVLEDFDAEGPKLSWTVHSHQELKEVEVQLKGIDGDTEWKRFDVKIPENQKRDYSFSYIVSDNELEPGKYEAIVKVTNTHNTTQSDRREIVEIVEEHGVIRQASVFRGSAIRPESTILASIMTYLLVRMF